MDLRAYKNAADVGITKTLWTGILMRCTWYGTGGTGHLKCILPKKPPPPQETIAVKENGIRRRQQ